MIEFPIGINCLPIQIMDRISGLSFKMVYHIRINKELRLQRSSDTKNTDDFSSI